MRHFAWSAENEVFIAQIDAEHRDLFQTAEGLERSLEEKAAPAETQQYLQALAAHMEEHFSHEEWLMQSVRYPLFGWHRQQHDTARRRLKLFLPLIEEGNVEAVSAFFEFLAGWLNDHTTVTDRMMAAFVRNYERAHAASALERWEARFEVSPTKRETADPEQAGPVPSAVRLGHS
jgi:hemerythrin